MGYCDTMKQAEFLDWLIKERCCNQGNEKQSDNQSTANRIRKVTFWRQNQTASVKFCNLVFILTGAESSFLFA